MKKTLLTAIMFSFLATQAFAASEPCPDPDCDDPVSQAIRGAAESAENTYKELAEDVIQDNQEGLQACLDSIRKFNGLDVSLLLPDLSNVLGKVCEAVVDEVNERIDKLMGKYTYEALGGLVGGSVGTSSTGSSMDVRVKDFSGSIANRLGSVVDKALDF